MKEEIQVDFKLKVIKEFRRISIPIAFLSSFSQAFQLTFSSGLSDYLNNVQRRQAENVL